jgi:hypothetical protein
LAIISELVQGIIIYIFVSEFAISSGVAPIIANLIGAGTALGEIAFHIRLRLL